MPYEFIALEEDDASAIANPEQLQQVLQDDAGRYLDFSAALNEDCLDTEQVHRQTMQSVLRVCYWSLFFLGWVGVPFVQGILLSSEFSLRCAPLQREATAARPLAQPADCGDWAPRRRERAQSSLRFNGIYYFVYMLVAIPIVVALAFRLNSFDIYVLKVRTQDASPRPDDRCL